MMALSLRKKGSWMQRSVLDEPSRACLSDRTAERNRPGYEMCGRP